MLYLLLWSSFVFADPPDPASVVGGAPASEGAWRDAAAIYKSSDAHCTGVLIASDLVITAGHCNGATRIQVDTIDLSKEDGVFRDVSESWLYPDYLETLDVLLMRLSEPVETPPRALALECIRDHYLKDGQDVTITGFGATDPDGLNFSDLLMEAHTTIIDATCSTPGRDCNDEVIPYGELIAGGDGIDSCVRDSGGPLYLRTPHGDYLAGITSRGIKPADVDCGEGGIYVRADAFSEWVEENAGVELPKPDCTELGLNQRPQPSADTLVASGGEGTTGINPGDPDDEDTHTYEILSPPIRGTATVDEDGRATYVGPAEESAEDVFLVRITDNGEPALSADLTINVEVEPLPFEDPGGCACAAGAGLPLISYTWLGFPLLLCHHRRRNRRRRE